MRTIQICSAKIFPREALQEPRARTDDDQDDRGILQPGETGDPVAADRDGGFRELEVQLRERIGGW